MNEVPVLRPPVVSLTDAQLATLHAVLAGPEPTLDWSLSVDRTLAPKPAEYGWLYGTPQWEALTPAQQREALWLENARLASDFVWLKEELSRSYESLCQRFGYRVPESVREVMAISARRQAASAELFRRYLAAAGLPLMPRPDFMNFIVAMEGNHPVAGLLCTFAMERIAGESARLQSSPDIDPMTRALYAVNAEEEPRQMLLAQMLCENSIANATMHETKVRMGYLVRGYLKAVMEHLALNTAIAERVTAPFVAWTKAMGIVSSRYQWSSLDQGALPLAHFARQHRKRPAAPRAAEMESAS